MNYTQISPSLSGAIRTFSFWIANGSVGNPLLDGTDYKQTLFDEPSSMEMAYAIFINNIKMNENGVVLNAKHAERRSAQWIRSYIDAAYTVEPPFADWETILHNPPPLRDVI